MKRLWQFLLCAAMLYAGAACNIVRDPAFESDVETVFVTATPFQPAGAAPSLTLPVSARRPASLEDAQQFDSPWTYVDFVDIQTPGEQDYEITIPPTTHRLSFSWCADSPQRLQEILGQVSVAFFLDGGQIDDSLVLQSDEDLCRQWDTIVDGWTVGQTVEAAIMYVIAAPIFDGVFDYAAGTYIQRILITVE